MTLITEIVVVVTVIAITFAGMLAANKKGNVIMWSVAVLAMTTIFLVTVGKENRNYYPATMSVIAVDEDRNIVTVETLNGIRYQFYGAENYNVEDAVSLIMDSCGTEIVTDDKIVDARFSGFIRVRGVKR